mmetsp:Transcript_13628/g.59483  ORF Transcript_13628/g.59483 Transcript_13628/m.59483 type:complete len:335 (-) Transcript_13628:1235-2239(-)
MRMFRRDSSRSSPGQSAPGPCTPGLLSSVRVVSSFNFAAVDVSHSCKPPLRALLPSSSICSAELWHSHWGTSPAIEFRVRSKIFKPDARRSTVGKTTRLLSARLIETIVARSTSARTFGSSTLVSALSLTSTLVSFGRVSNDSGTAPAILLPARFIFRSSTSDPGGTSATTPVRALCERSSSLRFCSAKMDAGSSPCRPSPERASEVSLVSLDMASAVGIVPAGASSKDPSPNALGSKLRFKTSSIAQFPTLSGMDPRSMFFPRFRVFMSCPQSTARGSPVSWLSATFTFCNRWMLPSQSPVSDVSLLTLASNSVSVVRQDISGSAPVSLLSFR